MSPWGSVEREAGAATARSCDTRGIVRSSLLRTLGFACTLGSLFAAEACSTSAGETTPHGSGGTGAEQAAASTGGSPVSGPAGSGGTGAAQAGAGAVATSGGSGGTTGGSATGGATENGGAGGTTASAGRNGNGGRTNAGGALGAGGTTGVGGKNATGGTTGTSGATGAGTAGSNATGGSAGAATGTPVCGTAAEDASVTLTCPTGQIIDSITFASFGTPTGSCGSFATSDCNATSSVSVVQSLCVGQSSCTFTASNGSFGDPCHGTTKHMDVQASCVTGTPAPTMMGPYKGVANSPAAQLSALGSTWCYNWGTTPKSTDCNDPDFVPMIWGSDNVASALAVIAKAGYTTVLGFNEPNKSDQSNISVADAIALWPDVTSNPNIRVGSPAVSDDGRSWLEDFMKQVKANGLRVDFIAMHWYGWNAGSCEASQLEGAVTWASQWGLPVWITEFGCMGSSNPDAQTVLDFYNAIVPMLAKHPLVERYAWYPWNTYNELYDSSGNITDLGKAFQAAPQYKQ